MEPTKPSERRVRESYREQACLTQAHRWIAAELSESTDRRSVDLLAPGARLAESTPMENALDARPVISEAIVESTDVDVRDDAGAVRFTLGPGSSTTRGTPSGRAGLRSIVVHFARVSTSLPLISEISLDVGPLEGAVQGPAQAVSSRLLSLKHRWHGLVERPDRHAAPFREIVSPAFVMDWGRGSVSSFAELGEWVAGSASSVAAARHDIVSFRWHEPGPGRFTAEYEFAWSGYSHENRRLAARSKHVWQVKDDDPSRRFPRIVRMDVEFLEPFHPVPEP